MKVFTVLFFTFCLMPAQSKMSVDQLRSTLLSILAGRQGDFAIAYYHPSTGESLAINDTVHFHAASTMKTPVMVEVFRQAAEGKFSLDDSVIITNSFRSIIDGSEYSLSLSDDSDDGLYHRIGKKETIRTLVYKMITVSSNLSTNILIGIVGPENVMKTLSEMDIRHFLVLRGVEDGKAYDAGKNNTVTAADLVKLFNSIGNKTAVSTEASEAMLEILKDQKYRGMIPARLPAEVVVAHKTGSITNVQHDGGIVYLPDGRWYVLVLLSKNLRSNSEGIEILSTLSLAVYDFVIQE